MLRWDKVGSVTLDWAAQRQAKLDVRLGNGQFRRMNSHNEMNAHDKNERTHANSEV